MNNLVDSSGFAAWVGVVHYISTKSGGINPSYTHEKLGFKTRNFRNEQTSTTLPAPMPHSIAERPMKFCATNYNTLKGSGSVRNDISQIGRCSFYTLMLKILKIGCSERCA